MHLDFTGCDLCKARLERSLRYDLSQVITAFDQCNARLKESLINLLSTITCQFCCPMCLLVEPTEKEVVVRRLEIMKEANTCLHSRATFDILNCVCVLETEFQKKKNRGQHKVKKNPGSGVWRAKSGIRLPSYYTGLYLRGTILAPKQLPPPPPP